MCIRDSWNGENGEKDTFKLKVNDNAVNTQEAGGNSYNPYSEAASVTITVNAINEAPTVTGATVSTGEDAAYTFSNQAFNQDYSDAESNTLVNVKIETLPNNGTLKLGQQTVTANQEIPGDQISQLTFVPIADWNDEFISSNGANNEKTTFTFSVNDGGESPNPYSSNRTITISVTSLNDPPKFSLGTELIEVDEDFETSQVINVTPEGIPIGETDQIVTYHLSPETVDFADLSIDPETGTITITAISNLEGDEDVDVVATEYLLTAVDGK